MRALIGSSVAMETVAVLIGGILLPASDVEQPVPGGEDARVRLERKHQLWLGSAAIVLTTFFSYWPALRGEFVWDDDRHVSENRLLRDFTGLRRIWFDIVTHPAQYPLPQYYPLTHTSFWIEYQFWRLEPAGYHVVNVLLHSLNALLLWRLLRVLELPGAWLAAFVFAVHPVNVESVAWITERKNVLAMCFALASAIAFFRVSERSYGTSLVFFLCALLSKTVTATLPGVLLVLIWWKQGRIKRRDWLRVMPMFALGAMLGSVTALLERYHVGAAGADWDLSWLDRVLISGRALWFYCWKLAWPTNLAFSYTRWDVTPANSWGYVLAVAGALGLLWAFRARIGRGALASALIYIGTLFPALGFFNVYPMRYSFVADHFQYLSAPALIAAVVAMSTVLVPRVAMLWLAPILVLAMLSWRQSHIYQSAESLWRDTIAKNPNSWMARNNLAITLAALADRDRAGGDEARANQRLIEALELLDAVERLRPEHENARITRADTLVRLNRLHEALEILQAELSARPDDPALRRRIATLLELTGDVEGAARQYQEILLVRPAEPPAMLDLGLLLAKHGHPAEARPWLERYVQLRPGDGQARVALGYVLMDLGDSAAAREQFTAALQLDPANAAAAHGLMLLQQK